MKRVIYILVIILSFLFINRINAYTEYKVGDVVTYNEIEFYVIKDSSSNDDSVTMLKAEPLTVDEVNLYGGVGTDDNHVNMYNAFSNDSYYRTAYNNNGYGGMAFYSSVDCGYGEDSNRTYSGCNVNYADSDIKYVVDAWASAQAKEASEARLISHDDLITNLGYIDSLDTSETKQSSAGETPS